MGLKWISSYCRHATFLLKTDDDIFVNIFSLVTHLQRISQQRSKPVTELLLCLVWYHMKVIRDPRSKWYISPTEYPDNVFPTYCSGSAFIMTPDVASAMFNASFRVPFFWVDDFYVTGLLAGEVGVSHQNFNSVYMLSPSAFLQKFTDPKVSLTLVIGHVHKINSLKMVWNKVLAEQRLWKRNATGSVTTPSPNSWHHHFDGTVVILFLTFQYIVMWLLMNYDILFYVIFDFPTMFATIVIVKVHVWVSSISTSRSCVLFLLVPCRLCFQI